MEVEPLKLEAPPMTYDEASLERSKSFVKALQELKNLRPQLYSAAEYCEKSYLHSEQKQMVLDNLKDYALQALVNAVDHLGTVAYKLTGLVEQQTIDVDSVDLRLACLNQQVLTCQTYMDKEGLRQQRLLAIIPRHHKRYILPNATNKKVHFSPNTQTDSSQAHAHARPRVHPSVTQQKTLSWHLASGTKPSKKWTHRSPMSSELQEPYAKSPPVFHLLDNKDVYQTRSPTATLMSSRNHSSGVVRPFATSSKDSSTGSRPMTPYRSFDNSSRQQQQVLTCQTYMDKEGLRQQRLLAIIPRHHKRYILPNSTNKKVHFSPNTQTDSSQVHAHARPQVHPSLRYVFLRWKFNTYFIFFYFSILILNINRLVYPKNEIEST